jgi:Rieske Fe-S protein
MSDKRVMTTEVKESSSVPVMHRRGWLGLATIAVGTIMGLALAIPGVAYLLSPLRKRNRDRQFQTVTRLSDLEVGIPRSFVIIEEQQDAWVHYPREPVGSVWLIRQAAGANPAVIALSAECPHLGCAINLSADHQGFLCPCHTSAFTFEGKPKNAVPPRPMDPLEVELTAGDDPEIRVRFQRFRTQSEARIPLV